ncbi:ubiquitin-related domain-containing protein [Limtongia smithiae]|uniref:ubiquitin-related domain-containing protein n=1 Tax=Limtongia smithiae TaxID=1125753 RepID=UPI0034CFA541
MSTDSAEFAQVFETSVSQAVGRSVQEHIPLIVYVTDASDASAQWNDELLTDHDVNDILRDHAVALRLENGSTEAGYFAQLFPIATVPSLYIVSNGSVVDYVFGDVDLQSFLARLRRALVPEQQDQSSEALEAVIPNSSAASATPVSTPSSPITARPAPPISPIPASTPPAPVADPSTSKKPVKQGPIKFIETGQTHNRYQEELRRKRIQESEERKRILKLVQDDREEMRARTSDVAGRSSMSESRESEVPGEHKHKRVASVDIHRHSNSAIAIRLFDGSSIKNRFPLESTLGDVRVWIDSCRTDGDQPYSIISQFPNRVFSLSDESQTLVELGLHPTATLFLKPISNYTSAYSPSTVMDRVWSSVGSRLSWAKGAVGTFLGYGYTEPVQEPGATYRTPDLTAYAQASQSMSPTSSSGGPQTLQDLNTDADDRRTYNGNQLNLEDDS